MRETRVRLITTLSIIVILLVLTAAALLLITRPDRDDAAARPGVPTAVAGAAGTISEQRFIDGATVTLVFLSGQQYFTQTEGSPGPVQPEPQPTQPVEPQPTQPAPTEPPAPTPLPTETPSAGTGPALPGAPSGNPIITIQYSVVQGDTLYGITRKENTSIALMAENGIDHRDIIAGETIPIPVVNPTYCTGFRAHHLVVEGDNVFRIAEKYNTTKEQIQQANGLPADYMIRTNDVLCIP